MLGLPAKPTPHAGKPAKLGHKKRAVSKEARQKMSVAQKRRWASVKKQKDKS
jgi:hypothetical protein